MRKKKVYQQTIKRIYRPEMTHCVDCGSRLRRKVTISERTVITLSEVITVVHCGYCCPQQACVGHKRLYRSRQADALALPGFTFGLDIVLLVGHWRLREHRTIDEIHMALLERLAQVHQTISRREILFLFEAYTALLRARKYYPHSLRSPGNQEKRGSFLSAFQRTLRTEEMVKHE